MHFLAWIVFGVLFAAAVDCVRWIWPTSTHKPSKWAWRLVLPFAVLSAVTSLTHTGWRDFLVDEAIAFAIVAALLTPILILRRRRKRQEN